MKESIISLFGLCVFASVTFVGCKSPQNVVGVEKSWETVTEKEAVATVARLFAAPQGAEVLEWLKCEELGNPEEYLSPVIQLSFSLDGKIFTARAQSGTEESKDISGIFAEWNSAIKDITLANWGDGLMKGKIYHSENNSGQIHLITWYDIEIGISYSLSVAAKNLEGTDLQKIAEQMYCAENEPNIP